MKVTLQHKISLRRYRQRFTENSPAENGFIFKRQDTRLRRNNTALNSVTEYGILIRLLLMNIH